MKADFVFVAEGCRDPALRQVGGGVGDLLLGQNNDAARRGQFDGCAQSGHSGSNDYEISFGWRSFH